MGGKKLGELGQSVCDAINQLDCVSQTLAHISNRGLILGRRTVAEIRRKVIKWSRRGVVSRFLHAKSDKEAIATWETNFKVGGSGGSSVDGCGYNIASGDLPDRVAAVELTIRHSLYLPTRNIAMKSDLSSTASGDSRRQISVSYAARVSSPSLPARPRSGIAKTDDRIPRPMQSEWFRIKGLRSIYGALRT
jgi:hypothetical protein